MKKLVINGPENYPGALYIIRPDGKRIRLEFVVDRTKIAEAVELGFVVERHLKNGDIAIFNRQPSLHRMSIMAHYVRVLPYKTFRMHLCVCPPYNADFDGDEMNLHVPQSEEARTEALACSCRSKTRFSHPDSADQSSAPSETSSQAHTTSPKKATT